MSGLAGLLVTREGAPPPEKIAILAAAVSARGSGTGRTARAGPATMHYRPFVTSPGSAVGQPLEGRDGSLLCWDGRLDNGEELLGGAHELEVERPGGDDASIVLATYRRWGLGCLDRLVGDFALALWDAPARRLVLARDPFGIRPLFFTDAGPEIAWASTLDALLRLGAAPAVNPEFLADFLTFGRFCWQSPYLSIHAVAPGGVAVFEGGTWSRRRYWPSDLGTLQLDSDAEYEERFRELFAEAVRCRLRGSRTAWCELSGGLDSTSIVCTADRIVADGECDTDSVETLSYIFDEAASCDERRYIDIVDGWRRHRGVRLREDDHRLLEPLPRDFMLDRPTTECFFLGRHQAVHRQLEQLGCRTLLRGIGGDHVLWGQSPFPVQLADQLVRGRLGAMLRTAASWSRPSRTSLLQVLAGGGLAPLIPASWRSRLPGAADLPDWLDETWVRSHGVRERWAGSPDSGGFALPSRREHFRLLQSLSVSASWPFLLATGCLDTAYPFLDRRLVDFALAVPMDQKLRPGEPRSLLRRAMNGRIPPEIQRRRSKAGPDEALYRGLARQWPRLAPLFDEPLVAGLGIVEPRGLRQALARARYGRASDAPLLFRTIAIEWWLRSLSQRTGHEPLAGPVLSPPETSRKEVSVHGADQAGLRSA